jgi:N-acyl-D-aspartate/D-glutamate deacylase
MTSLAAQRMGLQDRGILHDGLAADAVMFDKRVIDRATFDKPHTYPDGISLVVNGATVVRAGQRTGAKPGRPLYGPGYNQ